MKSHQLFQSYGNFAGSGKFCQLVELHPGGFAMNRATPFSFDILILEQLKLEMLFIGLDYRQILFHSGQSSWRTSGPAGAATRPIWHSCSSLISPPAWSRRSSRGNRNIEIVILNARKLFVAFTISPLGCPNELKYKKGVHPA